MGVNQMDARYLSESGEYLYGVLLGSNENTHYEYWVEFDEGTFSIAADLIEVEVEPDVWVILPIALEEGMV